MTDLAMMKGSKPIIISPLLSLRQRANCGRCCEPVFLKAAGGFVLDGAFQPPRRHQWFNIGFPKMFAVNHSRHRLEFLPRSGFIGGCVQHLFNLRSDLRGDCRVGSPQPLDKLTTFLAEFRCGQASLFSTGDHVEDTAAGFFGVAGQKHRVSNERVARNGSVRRTQRLGCEWRRKFSGIPDFETVGKKRDLHTGVAGVVAMGDGVGDGLGNGLAGEFVFDRCLWSKGARADGAGNFRHDKVNGLIHEFEDGAFVNLVRRNGLADFRAVEVHALDLGGEQEALGSSAKKENGGMSRLTGVEQIEMNQRLGRRCVFVQWVLPLTAGNAEEPFYLVFRDVGESSIGAGGGIKGSCADLRSTPAVRDSVRSQVMPSNLMEVSSVLGAPFSQLAGIPPCIDLMNMSATRLAELVGDQRRALDFPRMTCLHFSRWMGS